MNGHDAQPHKRGRGRPRKVEAGESDREWLRLSSAARLIDVPRSTLQDWAGPTPPLLRAPLEIKRLPSGQIRVRRASVLAQLAAVTLLAVEQLPAALLSATAARMGSEGGKMSAMAADVATWADRAGTGADGTPVGDVPTGRVGVTLGEIGEASISPVIALVERSNLTGGRGSCAARSLGSAYPLRPGK